MKKNNAVVNGKKQTNIENIEEMANRKAKSTQFGTQWYQWNVYGQPMICRVQGHWCSFGALANFYKDGF